MHVEWNPEWPESAPYATVRLFWGTHSIDALPIHRWKESVSILGVVDEHFDSERGRLRSALAYGDKKKGDKFEHAVVRLFNVLGIQTLWYGQMEDRADALGIVGLSRKNGEIRACFPYFAYFGVRAGEISLQSRLHGGESGIRIYSKT